MTCTVCFCVEKGRARQRKYVLQKESVRHGDGFDEFPHQRFVTQCGGSLFYTWPSPVKYLVSQPQGKQISAYSSCSKTVRALQKNTTEWFLTFFLWLSFKICKRSFSSSAEWKVSYKEVLHRLLSNNCTSYWILKLVIVKEFDWLNHIS